MHTPNQARNQIPAEAEAWLDIRFPPEDADLASQNPARSPPTCRASANRASRLWSTTWTRRTTPTPADPRSAASGKRPLAHGYQPDFLRKHGAGDGRFYGEGGIAAVAFGVGGHGQHGAEEYADIATIEPYYQALTQFLRDPGPAPGG